MASPHFVHLRLHSEFSITDGVVRIEDAVADLAKQYAHNKPVKTPKIASELASPAPRTGAEG